MSKKTSKKSSWVRETIPYVVLLVLVILFRIFILVNATVPTNSMENTILTGARVMGLKTAYRSSDPKRGDIIVFHAPDEPETLYVKRLIGLPGETVEIRQGVTYVNGRELKEDYLKEEMQKADYGPYVVPEDSYFMMGDNRNSSWDARFWDNTYVTRDAIVGKVYFGYWKSLGWMASTPDFGLDGE